MKAVVVARQGGPEALEQTDMDEPMPGDEELLVDVSAVGVNYNDVYNRSGAYPHAVPFVPGRELAGTVAAVGRAVRGFEVGDLVATADVPRPGAYAERVVVPASRAVPLPDGTPPDIAAAVLLQGLTADYLCRLTYPVQAGDVVVVHAAAGGTGFLLTQMVKMRGGHVIATVSSEEKAELVSSVGADHVICRSAVPFDKEVHRLTGGGGAAAVYDAIGRATFEQSLACLGRRGHLVLYGRASGAVGPRDLHELGPRGSLALHVPMLPDYIAMADELAEASAGLFRLVGQGLLQVHVGGRFPLEEARAAHEALQSQHTTGKLLLFPAAGRQA